MPGFGIHTYQVENNRGIQYFVKFLFEPDAGIKTLSSEQARNISATDPDYMTRDLFRSIANGDFPLWTVSVQILTLADVKKAGSKAFDVTRVISLDKHPLHPIGKIVLNRNAKNFFAEIEQLAFCPGNLVPGIKGGPDKIFEARRMAYRNAQLYRLGGNFQKILVNCPFQVRTFTYNRDGVPPVGMNEGDIPNYYPNSFHGPVPFMTDQSSSLIELIENKADNFDLLVELYENELTPDERTRFIENVVFSIQSADSYVQDKVIKIFTRIHFDFGNRVAQALNNTICN